MRSCRFNGGSAAFPSGVCASAMVHSFLGEHFLCRNELAKILVAHFQDAALDLALEIVHRSRRRTGNARAIEREDGGVAWTNELLLRFHPRNRTTEMRTDRREHAQDAILRRQNVNGFFRNDLSPAVPLIYRDQLFCRRGE